VPVADPWVTTVVARQSRLLLRRPLVVRPPGGVGCQISPDLRSRGVTRLRDREAAVDNPRTEVVTCMKTVLAQPGTGSPAVVNVLGPSEHAVDRTLSPAAHPAGLVPEAMVRPLRRLGWTRMLCRNQLVVPVQGKTGHDFLLKHRSASESFSCCDFHRPGVPVCFGS
jgi:hypothetical protein